MQNSLPQESHSLRIGAVQRDLPLFAVSPELAIAVLNILGDTELCEAAADALSKELDAHEYVALVTAEAKSIPLAYALSLRTQKPYVVLRKTYKSYMGDALQASTLSITTGKPQTLYLDAKDRKLLAPKHDSTGLVHVFEPAAQAVAGLERTGEFMFTNTRGTPMDSSTITHAFKAVKHIAGLPEATPGALRHFLASYMLNELSLPPYTIAQQLRHRDGGRLVVQTYGHPDRSMHLSRIAQAEAMGRVVGRPDDPEVAV